jgi:lipoate-protein ligase A
LTAAAPLGPEAASDSPDGPDAPDAPDTPEVPEWLDVERWRAVPRRTVAVRRPFARSVVLGSTQRPSVVSAAAVSAAGVAVARRRSGGGAVLVSPGSTLWMDAWVPASDALFSADVLRASWWVGDWWAGALASLGVAGAAVHRGRATRDGLSALVCFAGRGPGEVTVGARKVVGVAQWRCRQGALLQSLACEVWDPAPLLDLLVVPEALVDAARSVLPGVAAGAGELLPAGAAASVDAVGLGALEVALLDTLPPGDWEVERAG